MTCGYTTEPQKYTTVGILPCRASKGIGGTMLINGVTYVRWEERQIDD